MDSQSSKRQVELLAPAGGPDAALAAFEYGADAVYLGLQKFSARADADNFGPEELDQIVAFAHVLSPRRRVFVALNTLVQERELEGVVEALGTIADIGADAVIVQDLGVARLARAHFPSLRLHSSTQLAVHSRAGVETLARLGFDRVVLARELTLEEIREAASVPGIEVEAFLHGALCYAYSGVCLFSSHMVGRSGNRGSCAYPCRDDWRVEGAPAALRDGSPTPRDPSRGFAFSMKDLALPQLVPQLKDAGVACLKIEGRKKSPLYVSAAVGYYRALLDGTLAPGERAGREADIQAVFSRPWTSLYLRSHRDKDVADPDSVGHRGVRVGSVESVVRSGPQVLVRFETSRALERHDGLQIEIPGLGRPFGFGVDLLRLAAPRGGKPREVLRAEAGSTVEVGLPDGYPTIPEGAPVYCSSSQEVKKRYRFERPNLGANRSRLPLDVSATLGRDRLVVRARAVRPVSNRMPAVEASETLEGPFEPARDSSRTAEAFRKSMEKLGESRFELRTCELSDPEGLFLPASRLNELRRVLVGKVEAALCSQWEARVAAAKASLPAPAPAKSVAPVDPAWSIKVDRIAHLSAFEPRDWQGVAEAVIDVAHEGLDELEPRLESLAAALGPERVRLALPMICRRWEEPGLRRKIERLRALGYRRWEGSNLSAWSLLGIDPAAPSGAGLDLAVDWPIYVLNRVAAAQAMAMGASRVVLSPEDGLENLRPLLAGLGEKATVVVYQDTALFVSESCPYATLAGGCPGPAQCRFEGAQMVSSHGSEVEVINDRCRAITISRRPFSLARRRRELEEAGARSLRADFVWRLYEPAEVRAAWRGLRGEGAAPEGHVGNFDRGLA